MNIHPVYFIAGKRGGRLKLGVRSLQGWESGEGREGFVPGELVLAEAGGSIHTACRPRGSLHPPSRGGVRWKVTQPSRTPARVRRTLLVILQPGAANLGRRGRVVVSRLQSALALWRVHCTPPEKVHGLLVLKTYVPPPPKR